MCGRFILFTGEEYEEIRMIIKNIETNIKNSTKDMKVGEIFPTDMVPVVTSDEHNNRITNLLKWGFPNFRQPNGIIINARGESIEERPTFRKILYTNRCLIPACGFFEWKKSGNTKDKFLIKPKENNFFYMAGLYNNFINKSGEAYKAFVIITTEANKDMSLIHNRMPVIITDPAEAYGWIDNSTTKLSKIKSFIKPYGSNLHIENQSPSYQLQF